MKVGIVFSCFDLLHAGHCLMLHESRENCDYLIACLQTDPTVDRPEKNKPVQTLFERYIQLSAIEDIDVVVPYTTEAEILDILNSYKPNVRFIGEDYIGKDFTGKKLCEDLGIEIFYNSRKHSFSTSELRKRIKNS